MHKATAHRLLAALAVEGMVELTPQGYLLGTQSWTLGRAAQARFEIADLAAPSMRRIAEETGDVGLLSVPTGVHARCIARTEGHHPILPTSVQVGALRPLGCGAHALALLAALPDGAMAGAIEATSVERAEHYPFFDAIVLRAKVEETRREGYALAEGEIIGGMAAVAVAIPDPWGRPLAAISCAAIADRMAPARRPEIVALLRKEARLVQQRFAQVACA